MCQTRERGAWEYRLTLSPDMVQKEAVTVGVTGEHWESVWEGIKFYGRDLDASLISADLTPSSKATDYEQ